MISAIYPVYSQVPTITSFLPQTGAVGSAVTITGINFNATPSSNVVYFGGVKAPVNSASATQLLVTVPIGASYAPISITDVVSGLTGYSIVPFIVTFPGSATLSSSSFFPKIDFATGTVPSGIAIGDLDGDGKPDFVVTNNAANTISVFRNTSVGDSISANSFAAGVNFTTGTNPSGIALGDLDGDGKLDIVVSDGISGTISVFRNTSVSGSITAGSFSSKIDFATGGSGSGVAIADLDGDGRPDIVVTNRNSSTVSVLRNTSSSGAISFSTNVDFPTGPLPYGVAVVDLDGDGKLDLVVANTGENALSLFRNTSTPGSITASSFASRVNIATSGVPIAVVAADLNKDGKPDIISANTGDSTISVFQNNSTSGSITNGSFAAGIDFKLSAAPNAIAVGDLNGDGLPDVAVTNGNSNTLSVFLNANNAGGNVTNNSFASRVDYAVGTDPYGLAIGDLNGDGRPDLVATNSGGNTVSVLPSVVGSPSVTLNTSFIDFGYVAEGDSSSRALVIFDTPGDTLFVDSLYSTKKEIAFSMTRGTSIDSLKVSVVLRADSAGLFTDTVFIKSNALTPLLKIPVSARVYVRPGKPASCTVTPSGWSNAAAFTVTWTNSQNGMLPIDTLWYSIDTLPKSAAVVKNLVAAGTSASVPITQVGKDTVYFYLEDSLGNKNQDSIGSVVVKFDNNGPSIAVTQNNPSVDTIFVHSDGTLSSIPPVVSSATEPPNESGVMEFNLLYRRLDGQTWDSLNFSNDTVIIPTASFSKNGTVIGVEYRIQAVDSAGNSTLSNLFSFDVRYTSDLTVTDFSDIPSVHSLNLPVGQEVKAYRLLSVPYDPEDRRPSSFIDQSFGAHAVNGVPYVNWRMTRWVNGAWNDYESFKDSSIVIPGADFMMVSENQGKSAALSKPKLIRADKMLYTGVTLNQGWNLVGNPFLVDVPFDHLIFQGGNPVAHYYFSGTGTQGGWDSTSVDTLKSWQGLAVKVDSACTLKFDLAGILLPPASGSNRREPKAVAKVANPQTSSEWTLRFDAARDDIGMSCIGTEVGMKSGALKGFDKSDRFQAPFVGGRNILVSVQNEAGPLMKDIRPLSPEGDTWDLTVMTGDGFAKTKLSFGATDGISSQGFEATLIDITKGLAYDLTKQKTILVITGKDGVGTYRLIVGTSSFTEKNLGGVALIPSEPSLYNNYPNPFNPETIVRYAVPGTMKTARVLLKVYNVLGQEVRTLVNESVTPGFYEVSFDGRDLSSGPYFYRISITGGGVEYHEAKKMLLIR